MASCNWRELLRNSRQVVELKENSVSLTLCHVPAVLTPISQYSYLWIKWIWNFCWPKLVNILVMRKPCFGYTVRSYWSYCNETDSAGSPLQHNNNKIQVYGCETTKLLIEVKEIFAVAHLRKKVSCTVHQKMPVKLPNRKEPTQCGIGLSSLDVIVSDKLLTLPHVAPANCVPKVVEESCCCPAYFLKYQWGFKIAGQTNFWNTSETDVSYYVHGPLWLLYKMDYNLKLFFFYFHLRIFMDSFITFDLIYALRFRDNFENAPLIVLVNGLAL